MSARSLRVMVAEGAGVGILAPFETALDVSGLRWIPLRDAEPLRIGVAQRRKALPSPSALVVRRLINHRAAELLAAVESAQDHAPPRASPVDGPGRDRIRAARGPEGARPVPQPSSSSSVARSGRPLK
jgi:hypothetical protein